MAYKNTERYVEWATETVPESHRSCTFHKEINILNILEKFESISKLEKNKI